MDQDLVARIELLEARLHATARISEIFMAQFFALRGGDELGAFLDMAQGEAETLAFPSDTSSREAAMARTEALREAITHRIGHLRHRLGV